MNMDSASTIWAQVMESLKGKISENSLATWFLYIEPEFVNSDSLIVSVPSDFYRSILEIKFGEILKKAITSLNVCVNSVNIIVKANHCIEMYTSTPKTSNCKLISRLNPNFTFDGLIIGKCNNAAVNAAIDIANNLSSNYNPLYVYG